jgi:hypothetical protein
MRARLRDHPSRGSILGVSIAPWCLLSFCLIETATSMCRDTPHELDLKAAAYNMQVHKTTPPKSKSPNPSTIDTRQRHLQHPYPISPNPLAQAILTQNSLLQLPPTQFTPQPRTSLAPQCGVVSFDAGESRVDHVGPATTQAIMRRTAGCAGVEYLHHSLAWR